MLIPDMGQFIEEMRIANRLKELELRIIIQTKFSGETKMALFEEVEDIMKDADL